MKYTKNVHEEKTKAEIVRSMLLDAADSSRITLADGAKKLIFDQAYVTVRDGKLYCILCPISKIEGLSESAALVFVLSDDDGALLPVCDSVTLQGVFDEYYGTLRATEVTGDED